MSCKGCEHRALGCHSLCSVYKEYLKHNQAQKEARAKEQKATDDYYVARRPCYEK